MKNIFTSLAVLTALLGVSEAGHAAASPDELGEIRAQLQALMQRVDKLEQENGALKAANESLKAEGDYLKAETRGLRKDAATHANETGKVKGADWAGKVALKGDLRYRHEQIRDDTLNGAGVQTADRYRDRVRARVNIEAKATDDIVVGVGLATAEGGDPRSSNQSLDGVFSRKSVDLDLAYFDWRFADWGHLIGGKMKQPFVKPSQSLFWDNDVNPEGLAVAFNRGVWSATGYNYWVDEVSGPESAVTSDAHIVGAHVSARLPVGASTLVLGAHYYDLSAGQGRRGVFFNCNGASDGCANGNSTIGAPGAGVLAHDFEVAELFAEFNTAVGSLPLQAWADVAENQDPNDLNLAWAAGVRLGAASDYRTWELGALYQVVEKDALFAQLIDSDFGGGVTDSAGWTLRAGYAPVKNWVINATYFLNKLNIDAPNSAGMTDVDYERLQLDFNVKF